MTCRLQSDECVSKGREKKEETTPLLEDESPGRLGGEVDGSAVKSYFSSLRGAVAPRLLQRGPPSKPARREDGGTCEL